MGREWFQRGWTTASSVGLIGFAGLLAGCSVDCDETYCDAVRAGAAAYFGWELQCCREPDTPGCEDRAIRMQQYSLFAAEIRRACVEENWHRVRDIWDSIVDLLPVGVLQLVADDFCDGWDWTGCNVVAPFGPEDVAIGVIAFDATRSRLRLADQDLASGAAARAEIERRWSMRSGSVLVVEAFGIREGFAASGTITIAESVGMPGTFADDVPSWCRRWRPEVMDVELESGSTRIRLALEPGFEGNQVRFDGPDRGVITGAVRIDASSALPDGVALEFHRTMALQVPFVVEPGGGLRLMSERPVSLLELWPVDPAVSRWIADGAPETSFDQRESDCVRRARSVAESFLAVHPSCGGPSNP